MVASIRRDREASKRGGKRLDRRDPGMKEAPDIALPGKDFQQKMSSGALALWISGLQARGTGFLNTPLLKG